ncbi:MAG: ABC transporter transmembrane domain-containing protein [Solirubrobacteraceae bacterium]
MDPRLLRHANAARALIGTYVVLGAINGVLVIAQAWLIAVVISEAFDGRGLSQLCGALAALLAVVLGRAVVAWGAELASGRSSPRVKSQLRSALLARLTTDPGAASGPGTGAVATLAGRGIDALDAYYSLYLPQLLLAVIVPLAVVVALLAADWISGVIVAVTLPLIPVFMALVGATTRDRTAAQARILERLAGHFLDATSGLPTLKVFGAAKRQTQVIAEVADRHRVATLATLRITFLSSLTLELLSTISVAMVAVAVGLRLLAGDLDLRTALFVLVIAPEASAAEDTGGQLPRERRRRQRSGADLRAAGGSDPVARAACQRPRSDGRGARDAAAHRVVCGAGRTGARRGVAESGARRDRGSDGSQRLWEVDAAERDPGIHPADGRIGPHWRRRPGRAGSRRLA